MGAFDDSLRSYHRLMELREKYIDVDVLRILVSAVNGDVPDIQGNTGISGDVPDIQGNTGIKFRN